MKKFVTFCLAIACMATATAANPVIKNLGEGKYSLEVGDISMTINGEGGGKILSYKYKYAEVISQSTFPESFGSTFWTSPQKEWNWPPVQEFDKQPYTVEEKGSSLVMTSNVSARLKYRIRKEFSVDAKKNAIVVTYSIINESGETRKVAPWEITRVPNNGMIFFDAPTDQITPADLMPFKSELGISWYQTDEANQNRKINADGKGWLAYINNGLLMVKKFQDLNASEPAPDEAEIQVYVNRGKSYIELESQGAYTELKAFQGRYDYTFSDGEDIFIFNILALSLVRKYGDADDVERLENAMLSQVMDSATYLDCIPEMLNMLERDYRGGHQEFVENMVAKGLPVVEKYGSPYVLAAVYNDMSKMAKVKKLPERRIYYLERYFEAAEAQAVVKKTTFRVYMQMVNAAEDIKRKNIILEKQAKTDILTGIPNRFALNDYLQNAFEKAQEEQVFFGLEIFDIDNFKQYNDTYGHQTGDNCLAQVGELLSELVGEHMYAARYGGDEFVILYEGMEDSAITDFAERLKQRVSTLKVPSTGGKTITGISISQGIRNSVPTEWNRSWDYLYTADNALYSVKRKKKGEICLMHRSNFAGSTIDDSI